MGNSPDRPVVKRVQVVEEEEEEVVEGQLDPIHHLIRVGRVPFQADEDEFLIKFQTYKPEKLTDSIHFDMLLKIYEFANHHHINLMMHENPIYRLSLVRYIGAYLRSVYEWNPVSGESSRRFMLDNHEVLTRNSLGIQSTSGVRMIWREDEALHRLLSLFQICVGPYIVFYRQLYESQFQHDMCEFFWLSLIHKDLNPRALEIALKVASYIFHLSDIDWQRKMGIMMFKDIDDLSAYDNLTCEMIKQKNPRTLYVLKYFDFDEYSLSLYHLTGYVGFQRLNEPLPSWATFKRIKVLERIMLTTGEHIVLTRALRLFHTQDLPPGYWQRPDVRTLFKTVFLTHIHFFREGPVFKDFLHSYFKVTDYMLGFPYMDLVVHMISKDFPGYDAVLMQSIQEMLVRGKFQVLGVLTVLEEHRKTPLLHPLLLLLAKQLKFKAKPKEVEDADEERQPPKKRHDPGGRVYMTPFSKKSKLEVFSDSHSLCVEKIKALTLHPDVLRALEI